ncbi:tRNA (adenosine(37)-N6)-threonylcarbamoyltransferase complex dimerization subunit type 1 TsaB [Methylibium sp.]|uniref:tRNA (adenosine(37)-N6)-threonylcarbamoyltransferase complex dimerization subunit type 1 TsaB n=1 Tax=Methylibium sp. TaxID=2067992 RepID=UPI003D13AED1
MTPRLLVLDAATETLHLGLCRGDRAWVRALPGGALASSALLPALMALLAEARLGLRDLDAIGCGRGPGAFTGVRAACAVTQGLAFGAGRPVLMLDTLMAVAEDARRQGAADELWVAVDARMGEAYAARYRWADTGWTVLEPPALREPASLAARIAGEARPQQIAGSSLLAHAGAWAGLPGASWPDSAPRAAALLALARAAWARGEQVDAACALPLYVRDRVAQTTAERMALRQAQVTAQARGREPS